MEYILLIHKSKIKSSHSNHYATAIRSRAGVLYSLGVNIRRRPTQPRAYVALAVGLRIIPIRPLHSQEITIVATQNKHNGI